MRRRIAQDPLQHAAKRVARQHIVSDMVGRHGRSCRILKNGRRRGPPDSPVPHATLPAGRNQQGCWREIAAAQVEEMAKKDEWRLLLPGASEPRLTELNP